jgi:integrase
MDPYPAVVSASNEVAILPPATAASPVAVYLQTLGSPDSRRTMSGALDRLAELLVGEPTPAATIPWHEIRPDRTTFLRAALLDRYAPSTVRKMLAALSGVLYQCWRLELMDEASYRRAIAWGQVKGSGLTGARAGRSLQLGEMRALFGACASSPHPTTAARNAALIAVLFGVGTRRAEAVALDLEHYNRDTDHLELHGKGSKVRLGPVPSGGTEALAAWLTWRGYEPGPLFVAVNKGGRIDPMMRRLSTQAVYALLQRLARAAGVAPFSPHDCRRTYAGDLLDAGADLSTVKDLMGHASASTTAIYDRRGEHAKRRAAGLIHVPYQEPMTLPIE